MASSNHPMRIGPVAGIALPFLLAIVSAGCADSGFNFGMLFPVANQHPAGFVTGHGRVVQMAGGADKAKVENGMTCNSCHATTRNPDGSLPRSSRGSSITCLQCHKGGADGNPGHPAEFRATHGDIVLAAGSVAKATFDGKPCATCHTIEKAADGSIPRGKVSAAMDCFACHPGGPDGSPKHPSDWYATHGDTVLAGGGYQTATVNGVTCTSCHAATKDASGAVVASPQKRAREMHCFRCHPGGPDGDPGHASDYKVKHGAEIVAAGGYEQATSGGRSCTTCHAAAKDSSGNVLASPQKKAKDKTCYACHQGGPNGSPHANDAVWATAHGDAVVAAGGYAVATETTGDGARTCGTCHTTEKAAGQVPASPGARSTCFTCHAGGPTGSPDHPAGWTFTGHGAFTRAGGGYRNARINGLTCAACHTTDKAADGSVPASPEAAASACFKCHASGPPN